ncbi:MAG: preprotein translocase subunit SecA [Pseudomonadota bacterium]
MVGKILTSIFGSRNQRIIKGYQKTVLKINQYEAQVKDISDEELKAFTQKLKERLNNGETIDSLLVEAFAVVREASRRVLGMRHFDVQLIGGMSLHEGRIAEMRTGEGKTLVATLPAYLNALNGKGVHVVTVNDYLAKRDAEWMAPVFEFLGFSVGVIYSGQSTEEKQAAYQCDITYGTNNEYGFDFLRDNMAFQLEDKVQRELSFAIIDEVDSILIDEARTPLIISGAIEDSSELYRKIDKLIPGLEQQEQDGDDHKATVTKPGDYTIDEKGKQTFLTDDGQEKVEGWLIKEGILDEGESLYNVGSIGLLHHVNAALRAHVLYQRNVDYIVKNDQVIIVDEHTGRTMPGRRWSEGLHQAVEAKEGVRIQNESQTLASITFQNYFRQYEKLSGMTGTADTEAFELQHIYDLEVVVIPTNRPMVRKDYDDLIFLNAKDKYNAIVEQIVECSEKGQPVLVGTVSIESSELLSKFLEQKEIQHKVLNAKFHEKEAEIIAQAGRPGAVTIATNMAGRGTDIVLGGNLKSELEALGEEASDSEKEVAREEWKKRHEQVLEAGGLAIIGTERHESRRIDNQLRGRSGRQGDPGSSRFYLAFDDNLMRIFGNDKFATRMQRVGWKEGEAIEHRWVTRVIENAQRKVEGRNFDIRKQLLEYDDVANDQRMVIYEQRRELMSTSDVSQVVENFRSDVLQRHISGYIPPQSLEEQWDLEGLEEKIKTDFNEDLSLRDWIKSDKALNEQGLRNKIHQSFIDSYNRKAEQVGEEVIRQVEKQIMLQQLDLHWKEHLASMDQLRQGIHLRGYAQKNPKQEYKKEAFELFTDMLDALKFDVVSILSKLQVRTESDVDALEEKRREQNQARNVQYEHSNAAPLGGPEKQEPSGEPQTVVREGRKIGRNEPCPCGSGKKYKQCHGKLG